MIQRWFLPQFFNFFQHKKVSQVVKKTYCVPDMASLSNRDTGLPFERMQLFNVWSRRADGRTHPKDLHLDDKQGKKG
jgi:hypothetical protein